MVDFSRVQKELQECNKDVKVSGISVKPKADSLSHLIGTIPGPVDSPYEGGTFLIDIVLPGNSFSLIFLFSIQVFRCFCEILNFICSMSLSADYLFAYNCVAVWGNFSIKIVFIDNLFRFVNIIDLANMK